MYFSKMYVEKPAFIIGLNYEYIIIKFHTKSTACMERLFFRCRKYRGAQYRISVRNNRSSRLP